MNKKIFLSFGIIFFIAVLLFFGIGFFGENKGESELVYYKNAVLTGFVIDLDGNPVEGVEVFLGETKNLITDEVGSYKIDIPLGENKLISFKKKGFVPIHRSIDFTYETETYLEIIMFPQADFSLVNVSKESKVEMNKAALTTEENGFVVKGTNNVVEKASVSLTPFNPADELEISAFPGEFFGTRFDGSTTFFESFGFMKIEAFSEDGKQLDIAKGKTAIMKQPISAELAQSSPESIPLWYFDETKNDWIEKGIAEKICVSGECYYEGKIDTLGSWWNCDKPQETSTLNCDGSQGNGGNNKEGPFSNLMENLGKKAGLWVLDKVVGKIPVVGAFYDAFKLANNIVDSASTGTVSERISGAGGVAFEWGVKKIIGKLYPPLGIALDVASLVKDLLRESLRYSLGLYNNQYNLSCVASGEDYVGVSSSKIAPKKQLTPIIFSNGETIMPASNVGRPEMFVRANSNVGITLEGLDLVSEKIPTATGNVGETTNVSLDDLAAVTIPIEISPDGPNAYTRVLVTFTNKEGVDTVISKILTNKKPIAYLTILVRPGREGTIQVKEKSFTNKHNKKYNIPKLVSGEIYELEEQQIEIAEKKFNIQNKETASFSCPAHYAYLKKVIVEKDNGFTKSKSYDILYYDGKEIDRGDSINKVRLFGDNIVYEKDLFYNKEEYCGDYPYYDYSSNPKITCNERKTHIISNGVDLGKGENPEIWANHVVFQKLYPEKGFVYDGVTYGTDCNKYLGGYELWGDNFAYYCNDGINYGGKVFWNNKELGNGRIAGMHKDFLLVDKKREDNIRGEDYCVLYKEGINIHEFKGYCSSYSEIRKIGTFGDNYWFIDREDIYYNGEIIYSGKYPKIVAFGNDVLYGNYDEVFFNGTPVELKINSENKIENSSQTNFSLVNGNYIFTTEYYRGYEDYKRDKINFNGNYFDENYYLLEEKVFLFGNNWFVEVDEKEYPLMHRKIVFNGTEIGNIWFQRTALFDNKLAYVKVDSLEENGYGKLIYDNKVIDENYYVYHDYAIFGDNIIHKKTNDLVGNYLGNQHNNTEYFVNGKSIGFGYRTPEGKENIESIYVWPKLTTDTKLGTSTSNEYNITDLFDEKSRGGKIDTSGLLKEYSFDDIWLYCTNNWK